MRTVDLAVTGSHRDVGVGDPEVGIDAEAADDEHLAGAVVGV